jgi:hypothetical protein
MTTNARSTTSPVSTLARQYPTSNASASQTPVTRSALVWWERPPSSPGSVHVSLRADRSNDATLAIRSSHPAYGQQTRTGAPARQARNLAGPGTQASRRARLGVFGGVLLALFVGGFGIANMANASSSSKSEAETYIVRPGDSFWSIARSVQPKGDLRPLVADLIEAHGSTLLQVGDRVELDAS